MFAYDYRLRISHLPRAIKIGAAGILALYVADLLRLPQAYWAAISAFVVMGADVGATVRASWTRLIGTAIGAVAGAFFVQLWGSHMWSFGLAATGTALLCTFLNLEQSYRLACVTVAIVMLIHSPGISPWGLAARRFLEVSVGILVALAISALPPRTPAASRV